MHAYFMYTKSCSVPLAPGPLQGMSTPKNILQQQQQQQQQQQGTGGEE